MKVGTDGILLGAWAEASYAGNILDIGAGSGLIAIMLAQRNLNAKVTAVEIDQTAYLEARDNMQNCPWTDRMQIHHIAVQDFARQSEATFDAIISNPPFFTGGTFSYSQERNMVRHTIKLPHGELLMSVRKLLKPGGKFSLILPYLEGLRFCELAETYNLYCSRRQEVLPKADKPVERLLMEFTKEKPRVCIEEKQLIIQKEARNDWTGDFMDLTREFYLDM